MVYMRKPRLVMAEKLTIENYNGIKDWIQAELFSPGVRMTDLGMILENQNNRNLAVWGDYIVKEVDGSFHVWKQAAFEKAFEKFYG